eukprot:1157822-Pelagomonas_calceolata.AAC.26
MKGPPRHPLWLTVSVAQLGHFDLHAGQEGNRSARKLGACSLGTLVCIEGKKETNQLGSLERAAWAPWFALRARGKQISKEA